MSLADPAARILPETADRFITFLPAVAVVGQRNDLLTESIARRIRAGQGKPIQGEALQDSKVMPSAWARIPGVTVGAEAESMPLMRGALGGRCRAEIWVDNMRMTGIAGRALVEQHGSEWYGRDLDAVN